MQLVGDGYGDRSATILKWTGANGGTAINIIGPSKATLRDFSIQGNNIANGIVVTGVDQSGSRVFMNEVNAGGNQTNLLVNRLDHTRVLAYNSNFAYGTNSINVIGGPLASSGNPQGAQTILYACSQSNNPASHEVTNGGNLLVRDVWYESNNYGKFLNLSGLGTFTLDGSNVSSPASAGSPTMAITNFSGKATFVSSAMSDLDVSGNGTEAKILGLSVLTAGEKYIVDNTSPPATIRSFNTRYVDPGTGSSSLPSANIGVPDQAYLSTMLEQTRSVHAEILAPLADNVSDVRFYRVWLSQLVTGIELKAGSTQQANQAAAASNIYGYSNDALEMAQQGLQVKAKLNPTRSYFTLATNSSNDERLEIVVSDLTGRKLETKSGILPNGYLQFGEKYPAGVYLAEVKQGYKKVVVKLLKQ
jgi:hypothetical protein